MKLSDFTIGVTGLEHPYAPHAKQQAFHRSNKRFKVAAAGNRGGKTVAGALEFLGNIYRDVAAGRGKRTVTFGNVYVPRLRYWVITPTSELSKYSYDELVRYCPRELIKKVNATTREMRLEGDVQIEFKSTERPERLIAATVNGLWMDECSKCKPEAWRGGLRARIADQSGWAIFTTTPYGGRNNWVYQDLVSREGVDEHIGAFGWTTADNDYFPREEFEHAKANTPEAWFKRDWLASWDSFGGAIYEDFSDDMHVTNEARLRAEFGLDPRRPLREFFSRIVGAIDFGFAADGCILVVGEYGEGKWVVLDEVYGPGMRPIGTKTNYFDECKRLELKWGVRQWAADPEDQGAIFDLRNNGLNLTNAKKNVYMGIRRVASALHAGMDSGRPHLRIFDSCRNLLAEIRNYQWKPTRDQGGFLEEPADGQKDHACLAGDSLIDTVAGKVQIASLADLSSFTVLSPENGVIKQRQAYAFLTNRSSRTIALRYANGYLRCTPDHPVFTNRGWIRAEHVRRGDLLAKPDRSVEDAARLRRREVLLQPELLPLLRPRLQDGPSRADTSPAARGGVGGGKRSGSEWLACAPQEPGSFGQPARELGVLVTSGSRPGARERARDKHGCLASERRRQEVARRARPENIHRTANTGEGMRRVREGVPLEVQPLKRPVLPFELQDESVQQAAPWVHVTATEEAGFTDVYNLYVDGPSHAFVANGVVTHNCDALRYAAMELRLYDYVEKQRMNPNARPMF